VPSGTGVPAHTTADDLPQLGRRSFWAQPLEARLDGFARLRAYAPVVFHAEGRPGDGRPGFWSVTRHADVEHVSRNPEVFSSARGFTMDDLPPAMLEVLGSMIALDDPRHLRLRRLVLQAFSARTVSNLEPAIRRRAAVVVDELLARGACDFVEVAASPFPLQVICDLVGIPAGMEQQVRAWTDEIVGVNDPSVAGSEPDARGGGMYEFALELAAERRSSPQGVDLASGLVHADLDGERLSSNEFAAFVVLLLAAGNETTRTSLSWALHLLTEHPEQRAALWSDFGPRMRNASDEIVRWSSPVQHMRRTTTQDTGIAGVEIPAGAKVVVWYGSANHDEAVFADARRFDIGRGNASVQLGFGAGGPHHCLGAALARLEIRVLLDEIRERVPTLHSTAAPTLLLSPFANGITRLPCAV
jgi:cytochrome P450